MSVAIKRTEKAAQNGTRLRRSTRARGSGDGKGNRIAILDKPQKPQHAARQARLQSAFLKAYAKLGIVRRAAEAAGIDRQSHYDWLKEDPTYEARFAEAEVLAVRLMEDAVMQRVIEGEKEYIPNPHTGIVRDEHGAPIMQTKSNAQRDIAMLRAHRPEKYREERKLEITGANGSPLFSKPEINIVLVKQVMTDVHELLPQLPALTVIAGELSAPTETVDQSSDDQE